MTIFLLIASFLTGYVLGSVPFGFTVSKIIGKIDITRHGSGNVGGTNVLRTLGLKAGAIVMALDLLKAFAAVMIARAMMGSNTLAFEGLTLDWRTAQVLAALGAMIGHNWSLFLKFRGGKGMAAYIGGWFAIDYAIALFGGIILILTALRTRFMSMGSIIGSLAIICTLIILTLLFDYPPIYLAYSVVATMVVIYQHRRNIDRLQTGTELKFDGHANKQDNSSGKN